jgi:HTH-type transcriptional regulator, competence development regulator
MGLEWRLSLEALSAADRRGMARMALQEPETFGAVLRRIRQSKGLTQRDIARRIDMDFAYFSRLETDRLSGLPTRPTVEKIAQAMQCTTTETAELLAAAGRISKEMQARPELRRLFRTAAQLSPSALEELVQQAEERLKRQRNTPRRRGEGNDPSQNS